MHLPFEDDDRLVPICLRAVHREVGVAQQDVSGAVVDVSHRDADAHPDADLAITETEGRLQRLGDAIRDLA